MFMRIVKAESGEMTRVLEVKRNERPCLRAPISGRGEGLGHPAPKGSDRFFDNRGTIGAFRDAERPRSQTGANSHSS